jgi:hypothetical protein
VTQSAIRRIMGHMSSYESFKNRFFTSLAGHSAGREIHCKVVQLEQQYDVPEIDVRYLLVQWAGEGFIQLRAWDGDALRPWHEWPDLDSFFFNETDNAGHIRVALLQPGREYAELQGKAGIGFTAPI